MKYMLLIVFMSALLSSDCSWELVTNPTTGKEESVYICKDTECKWISTVDPITGRIEDKYICD